MNINLSIRFIVTEEEAVTQRGRILRDAVTRVACFRHAVFKTLEGLNIDFEIDEFGSDDNDMRQTSCDYCMLERLREDKK